MLVDINECTLNDTSPCALAVANGTGSCTNFSPVASNNYTSYVCSCITGYSLSGTDCVDIDECATNDGNCDNTTSTCVNSPGSYTCTCSTGYKWPIIGGGCVGMLFLSFNYFNFILVITN